MSSFVELVARLQDPNEAPGGNLFLRKALGLIPNHHGSFAVLDIGSNTGFSTMTISEHLLKSKIVGLDILDDMTKAAKANFKGNALSKRLDFKTGDAQDMPFKNETFDLVVSSGSLAFIDSPEKAVEEVYRVLKPKGFFLAVEYFYISQPPVVLLETIKSHLGVNVEKYTFDYWVNCFYDSGLGIEGVEKSSPPIYANEIRRKQQSCIELKLGKKDARTILKMDLDFGDNNKFLEIGIFLLRKPDQITGGSCSLPTRN